MDAHGIGGCAWNWRNGVTVTGGKATGMIFEGMEKISS